MATFTYQARDEFGKVVRGAMSAENEDILAGKLSNLGYVLTRSRPIKEREKVVSPPGRIKRRDIIMFTHHLSTIEASGISIRVGLRDLSEQTENEKFRKVIESLLRDVEGGATLSEAMDKHPRIFSELYVSMVRAGEATGALEDVLNRLAAQLEWQEETRGTITQALIYPVILFIAILGLITVILTFLVPRIMVIYTTANMPLPLPTRILITASNFLRGQWLLILTTLVIGVITYKLIGKTPGGRLQIDRLKLKTPLFGELIRKMCASRFSHTLAGLYHAGVGITEALWIVEKVIGNTVMAQAIKNTRLRVSNGETIAESLRVSGEFQPLVTRMLAVGEETGRLDQTLSKVNEFYDREVPQAVKRLLTLLEPMIIIFAGIVVAFVLAATFLPLYQALSLIRG